MAWSWSHTDDAYVNARENLSLQKRKWLEECYAEIKAQTDDDDFDEQLYDIVLAGASDLDRDVLISAIWDFAEDQATCDNGGYNAWMCPYGCHTVDFGPEEE